MKSIITMLLVLLCALRAEAKPNIIFIMADDLGWTDVAAFGSRYYETPNLDRLAAQGMKFTNYHIAQNCAPTRAALLSGQYGPRTGVYTVGSEDRFDWQSRPLRPVPNVTKLPLDKITFAQTLKKNGYATAMFGKWHLGEDKAGQYHPAARGFDEAIVANGKHFDFETNPPVKHAKDAYLADWLTDRAEDFIRRKKDAPFLLYLPHFGVHSPYEAKKALIEKFKDKKPAGGHGNATYAAMLYSVDESVGRIMALLEELKIADNTVLVFTSDNGGVGGFDRPDGLFRDKGAAAKGGAEAKSATDNAPLRSGKGSLFEGGTRAPLIVRWPGQVKPGSLCDVPTIHVDFYPTLLDLAAAPPPENHTLDGESLVPLLKQTHANLRRDAIFQHFPGYLGAGPGQFRGTPVSTVISGDWKLMEFMEDQHVELYNLREDIGETKNLAAAQPEKTQTLRARLAEWKTAVKAPMPTPNPTAKTDAAAKGKARRAR